MRHNKIGTIFLVSVLALAGIGISYAGFSDSLSIYGTVDTATVEIELTTWYSGTWVWKVWGDDYSGDEIYIWHGWVDEKPTDEAVLDIFNQDGATDVELVSWSYAMPGSYVFPDQTESDVDMEYHNLFPCIDFEADFVFHYIGSIPAKINVAEIFPILYDINYPDSEELAALWGIYQANPTAGFGMWVEAYLFNETTGQFELDLQGNKIPIDVGYQLHYCDSVYVKLVIHLPQDNIWQGLAGAFGGKIGVIQWYDCGTQPAP